MSGCLDEGNLLKLIRWDVKTKLCLATKPVSPTCNWVFLEASTQPLQHISCRLVELKGTLDSHASRTLISESSWPTPLIIGKQSEEPGGHVWLQDNRCASEPVKVSSTPVWFVSGGDARRSRSLEEDLGELFIPQGIICSSSSFLIPPPLPRDVFSHFSDATCSILSGSDSLQVFPRNAVCVS